MQTVDGSVVEVFLQREVPEGTDVVSCDMTGSLVLSGNNLGVMVPEVGESASIEVYNIGQDEPELFLAVDEEGSLSYAEGAIPDPPGTEPECEDTAHNELPSRMNLGETVYFNRSTTPSYLAWGFVEETLEASVRAWPTLYNNCGMPDDVTVGVTWGGNSEAVNSVQSSGGPSPFTYCDPAGTDTVSVTSFGSTPGTIAGTCRAGGGPTVGADVKLNSAWTWTRTPGAADCNGKIDIQSVATHEYGHFWGMDHVSATTHPQLTMRNGGTAAVTCRDALRTLGRGDVLGMRELY